MEKIKAKKIWSDVFGEMRGESTHSSSRYRSQDEEFYSAKEVDALLSDFRALLEACKNLKTFYKSDVYGPLFLARFAIDDSVEPIFKALAAVEARMKG